MERLHINEVVVVEGRYDASTLAGLIDGLIITTDGFSIFSNEEKKELLRRLGRQRGLLIVTDADAAGFKIRHYVEKIAAGCSIKHAYIPALPGKEPRKAAPGKEGLLGVEGLPPKLLLEALEAAGVRALPTAKNGGISYTDLYELGLSGQGNSAARRHALLKQLGLPPRLSKRALAQVLGSLYSRAQLEALLQTEKPVLFWDFHGTLTLPDINWFDMAMEAAAECAPSHPLQRETLLQHLSASCLPWFTVPSRDTRHISGSSAWWAHCEANFKVMYQRCGLAPGEARAAAGAIREKSLQPRRYRLYPDAKDTLEALKQRGYRSLVLSNNFPELSQVVEGLGLADCIEQVLSSGELGWEKPRPEIFEAAKKAVGNPATCWMIGDNPKDDIEGGNAAGFETVAVHNVNAPTATHRVDALEELLELLP